MAQAEAGSGRRTRALVALVALVGSCPRLQRLLLPQALRGSTTNASVSAWRGTPRPQHVGA